MKTWALSHLFILRRVTSPAWLSPLPCLPFCLPCAHWPSYLCHLALTGSAGFQTLKEGCPWFGQGHAQIRINGRCDQEQPHEGPGGVCSSTAAGISWQRSAGGTKPGSRSRASKCSNGRGSRVQGSHKGRNGRGELKRRQSLTLRSFGIGKGVAWIGVDPWLMTCRISLTTATRAAMIAIIKRCSLRDTVLYDCLA